MKLLTPELRKSFCHAGDALSPKFIINREPNPDVGRLAKVETWSNLNAG